MHPSAKTTDRPLMSISEAAEFAGLSKSAAYRLAAAGTLPGLVRLPGARMLVRRRVLENWLEGYEHDPDGSNDGVGSTATSDRSRREVRPPYRG